MEIRHTFNLGSYEIIQRKDNGYFSASYLVFQFNRAKGAKLKPFDFLKRRDTALRMYHMRQIPEFATNEDYFKFDGNLWLHPGLLFEFIVWLDDNDLKKGFWRWFLYHKKDQLNEIFNFKNQ